MDFCVFSTLALSSLASGALVTTQGWAWLNLASVPAVLAMAAALLWLAMRRRQATRVAA